MVKSTLPCNIKDDLVKVRDALRGMYEDESKTEGVSRPSIELNIPYSRNNCFVFAP